MPVYYEAQGRHYMSVMNVDRVYYCCLYGNNEDEAIIRRIDRDMAYESELIAVEEDFWINHVLTQAPPPFTETGDLILESLQRWLGPADKDAPAVLLDDLQAQQITSYLDLQEKKRALSSEVTQIENGMKRLKGLIVSVGERNAQSAALIEQLHRSFDQFFPVQIQVSAFGAGIFQGIKQCAMNGKDGYELHRHMRLR